MEREKLNPYIIQETHLTGDFERALPREMTMIHHGPDIQPSRGAKKGVATFQKN